jgi:MFS family permease
MSDPNLPTERPRQTAEEVERRNFRVNVVEGGLFMAGATFMSVQTVIPAMVLDIGGGNLAVGSLGLIAWGGLFLPQIFAARYFESVPLKKPWAIRLGLVQRILVGIIPLALLLWGEDDPVVALALFLTLYALMHICLGVIVPAWFDLVAKVTPVRRRGRLAGYRSSLAGLMGFGSSFLLAWILFEFPSPLKYAIAISIAFVFQMISLWVQSGLVELDPSPVSEKKPILKFLSEIPPMLHANKSFRNFIGATFFLVLATISVTFFPVYAIRRFGGDSSIAGEFTLVMVASQVVSAPLMGFLADRFGNKLTLIVAAGALWSAALWAVLAPSLMWFYLVFAFLGVNVGSEIMARYNIAVEFARDQRRAIHLGLMNALLAPCYAVGLLGGWLSDLFGYETVFLSGALCSSIGVMIMIIAVREPRGHAVGVDAAG